MKEAAAEAAGTLQLYSDLSALKLRTLLAESCGVQPDQVTVSNGSDEILAFAFQAFGDCGLAFPDITYGFYPVWAALYGLDARIVPLDQDFRVRAADYYGCGRTVVLANPNAPTGIALPLAEIARIAETNRDNVVIVDEAYVDFGAESAVKLLKDHENILVTRTFSKSRQMAGARLGFAVGSRELIGDLDRVRYSFHPYNVDSMTQAAGAAALMQPDYFEACRKSTMETRAWTRDQLEGIGFSVLPSKANFLFAKPPKISGKACQDALRERNILVRRFDLPRVKDYLRITIGSKEQMNALIRALKEMIA